MKNYQHIELSREASVAIIKLNRPKAFNSLSTLMVDELFDAIIDCDQSTDIRAVIITAEGKAFCTGGDLKEFSSQSENLYAHIRKVIEPFHAMIAQINAMDTPVIGAINGIAAGGGFSLSLGLDLAIAAESAQFTLAYTKAAISPDGGSTHFLARHIGLRRAKEMALLNPVLSAQQALDWGIINRVVDDSELMAEAMKMAQQLAAGPTACYGETKRMLLAGSNETLEAQLDRESRTAARLIDSTDGQEGMQAFLEKRLPLYQGS